MTVDRYTYIKCWYGIPIADYEAMLVAHKGKCAACGEGETALSAKGDVRWLCVDHCHKTGRVRGLLCDRCNNILGRAKDSVDVLQDLIEYLEKNAVAASSPSVQDLTELKGA